MKYCPRCGAKNEDNALFCTNCGASLEGNADASLKAEPVKNTVPSSNESTKSRGLATILCAVFYCTGLAGLHRFYAGKIGTGILWLLTAGLFGIGQLIDLIMLLCGSFEDSDGNPLKSWDIN